MASLGELFISLGFDVDDEKLKGFEEKLNTTKEGMLKLSAAAVAALGVLTLFVNHAADGAVRLHNMAVQFGVNTQAAQTYANALHQVNTAISLQAGQEQYKAFSNLINAKVPQGSGAFAALALLGVTNPYGTPEEVFSEIQKNREKALRENFTGDAKKRLAQYSTRLEEIGLPGSYEAIAQSPEKYNAASQYNVPEAQIEHLTHFSQSVAVLDEAFTKFTYSLSDLSVGYLIPLIEKLTIAFQGLDDWLNGKTHLVEVHKMTDAEYDAKSKDTWDFLTSPSRWGELFTGDGTSAMSKPNAGSAAPASASSGDNYIWEGIKKAFMMESSGKADVYGQGEEAEGQKNEAYGLFQLHPDRQADYNKWAKENGRHTLKGSSAEDQMQYMLYDITKGLNKSVGEKLSHTQNADEAFKVFRKDYERPAGAQNIVINVNSKAPAHDVAAEVMRGIQSTMNIAKPQTNVGSPF